MNEFDGRAYAELAWAKAAFDGQERLQKLIEPLQDPLARYLVNSAPTATKIVEQQVARDLSNLHRNVAEIEAARAVFTAPEQSYLPTLSPVVEYQPERPQQLIEPLHDPLAHHLAHLSPTSTQIVEQHAARDIANHRRNMAEIEVARSVFTAQEQL